MNIDDLLTGKIVEASLVLSRVDTREEAIFTGGTLLALCTMRTNLAANAAEALECKVKDLEERLDEVTVERDEMADAIGQGEDFALGEGQPRVRVADLPLLSVFRWNGLVYLLTNKKGGPGYACVIVVTDDSGIRFKDRAVGTMDLDTVVDRLDAKLTIG